MQEKNAMTIDGLDVGRGFDLPRLSDFIVVGKLSIWIHGRCREPVVEGLTTVRIYEYIAYNLTEPISKSKEQFSRTLGWNLESHELKKKIPSESIDLKSVSHTPSSKLIDTDNCSLFTFGLSCFGYILI